jgi:Tetratricopeptide repeat
MMLPCALLTWSMTMAASFAAGSPQQPPKIVLVDDNAELEEALASRSPRRELPVRLTVVSLPDDTPAKVRVLMMAEIDESQGSSALASVAYAMTDDRGHRQAHALRRVELRRLPSGALAFLEIVTVPPGGYRLKIAALRNTRVGTAEASVSARVQSAASFRFGDLLIGEVPGGDAVTNLAPERRVRGNRLVATLPLGADPTLPSDLAITVEVAKGQSGTAMLSAPAPVLPGEGPTRLAQALLDTRVLPAGEYDARVIVSVAGREAGRGFVAFTLEHAAAPGTGAPTPRSGGVPGGPAAPGGAPGFRPEEVLDPAVLTPFLDDLAARASDRTRPAIDQARAGRLVEAAQAITANDPNDPVRPFLQGLSLFSRKQLQPASDAFRDTLRAAPDFFVGAFYIGACYAAGGRDPQAINAWQTSLVGLDHYPIVYRLLSEAMARTGQPERAMDTLDEAIAKWPDDRDIRLRLARAALDARRYDRVLGLADAGVARTPSDPDLLFVGMQAIFEAVTQGKNAQLDDALARMKRYRDAYVSAGGTRQALVAEWVGAVEKKVPPGKNPS